MLLIASQHLDAARYRIVGKTKNQTYTNDETKVD